MPPEELRATADIAKVVQPPRPLPVCGLSLLDCVNCILTYVFFTALRVPSLGRVTTPSAQSQKLSNVKKSDFKKNNSMLKFVQYDDLFFYC